MDGEILGVWWSNLSHVVGVILRRWDYRGNSLRVSRGRTNWCGEGAATGTTRLCPGTSGLLLTGPWVPGEDAP